MGNILSAIDSFMGDYRFLSNFYQVAVFYEGRSYPSVEHAYQACKTMDPLIRMCVAESLTSAAAKKVGRGLRLRPDWEEVKFKIMLDLLRLKFANPSLKEKLIETGNRELVEGNHWGDTIWGVCNGVGQNHLGKLLMQVRGELHEVAAKSVSNESEDEEEWWLSEKSDKLWTEDDCTTSDPDHESLKGAWERIFGSPLDFSMAIDEEDGGDADFYLFDRGLIAISSYPGNAEIRLLKMCGIPAGKICPTHRKAYSRHTGECWKCPSGTQVTIQENLDEYLIRGILLSCFG